MQRADINKSPFSKCKAQSQARQAEEKCGENEFGKVISVWEIYTWYLIFQKTVVSLALYSSFGIYSDADAEEDTSMVCAFHKVSEDNSALKSKGLFDILQNSFKEDTSKEEWSINESKFWE